MTEQLDSPRGSGITALREKLGGTRDIRRILIANNGLAAVKGITSIRKWLYDQTDSADCIQFVVMATPEDLAANAEYIRIADHHVEVPGGSNANNYANVELIVNTAVQYGVDAVYPGWGHASENPALPRELEKTRTKIIFLGPPEGPMFSLGDKIASSVVAQCHGVPCVPWSGMDVRVPEGTYNVEPALYEKAYVQTAEQCVELCKKIGFPVMIKASEGGGGKGIRRAFNLGEVAERFTAVENEVKGCHIFVMRLLENVRHLEVQLLADRYGDCIAVRTRDCSVQRRHQKIIEEGPVVSVPDDIVPEMEAAAIRLAKAVGYSGLGTVEFMYDRDKHTFSFLELNPRIQVEHPVSELISGVNLPAALLCVGMGVPLHRIPEVRQLYNLKPHDTTPIDFDIVAPLPPKGHAIAVRITAEDANEGFQPTSGAIDELSFTNSKECWGYFSTSSGGRIHEYADSQFGHIFSTGATREDARRGAVMALRGLHVRGEIRTSIGFLIDLLEAPDFRDVAIHTAWLDAILANNAGPKQVGGDVYPALCAAAIIRMKRFRDGNIEKYRQFVKAGHTPSVDFLSNRRTETFVLHNRKFVVDVGMLNPSDYVIALNGNTLIVPCREFSTGALHMTLGGRTVIAYGEEETSSLRITINGRATIFSSDVDPTMLRSAVPGRLVRFLVADGGHVDLGEPYAEVEVMKMMMQLKAGVAGTVALRATAGCTLVAGKLLAEVEPDDPSAVSRPVIDDTVWPEGLSNAAVAPQSHSDRLDAVTRVRAAVDTVWNLLQGYAFSEIGLRRQIDTIIEALPSLCLSSVTLASLNRSWLANAPASNAPTEKLRALFECLVERFLETEHWFDGISRPEALDRLREFHADDEENGLDAIFAVDFAHHHNHRQEVIKSLLMYMENNHALMKASHGMLQRLSSLQSSQQYGLVLLQARYLLRLCSQPSFDDRVSALLEELEKGDVTKIATRSVGFDVMASVMFSRRSPQLTPLAVELFVRRAFFGVGVVSGLDIFKAGSSWRGAWRFDTKADSPVTPATPLVLAPGKDVAQGVTHMPAHGWGFCSLYFDERDLTDNFGPFMEHVAAEASEEAIAMAFLSARPEATVAELLEVCNRAVESQSTVLLKSTNKLQHITFLVNGPSHGPHLFTFSRENSFQEDSIYRNVLPSTAARLELHRLSNFKLEMFPTPHRAVHTYVAYPRDLAVAPRPIDQRLFVRMYLSSGDLGIPSGSILSQEDAAHAINSVINAVEFARSDKRLGATVFNHLFINLIDIGLDMRTLLPFIKSLAEMFEKRFFKLGFREMELKFQADTPDGPVPFRMFLMNHTTYALQVETYIEVVGEDGEIKLQKATYASDIERITELPREAWGSTADLNASAGEDDASVSDGTPDTPADARRLASLRGILPDRKRVSVGDAADTISLTYPLMSTKQVKRLQAQANGTTYVHDWMLLFEVALRQQWKDFVTKRGLDAKVVPYQGVWHPEELRYNAKTEKLETGRPVAGEHSGMVAWRCNYFPPASFDLEQGKAVSRKFIAVANDITFQSGSFSVSEDVVFKAASDLAREEKLPFVYVSANSGARLGLCNEVKKCFRVATRGDSFDYIYLTPADFEALTAKGVVVNCEKIEVEVPVATGGTSTETRHRILDIIGTDTEYLGVENLQGSALIAGHMSLNYSTVPTLSIATGRTVGIGAYLVRLGRRVIQTKNSPIILTGAGALNRLLGKEVYSGNNQLGGNAIMQPNGVTHWEAKDDLHSVKVTLDWLDFVPPTTDAPANGITKLTLAQADPVDRDVTFAPARDQPYDPRFLIDGNSEDNSLGLFDKGSFRESLKDWAKSVVTGRATLGGIACGVVVVETRITKKFNPADPADPSSTSSFMSQAGQVWFPDSARKTADALEDFHHEQLPCFVLANWRGFSGGMRDMYDEVMKFGASIVDNLRVYKQPVFIYIPPFGELRGGAWVVVDPVINHNGCVQMYCDTSARGGILEPAGVVEIKFREAELRQCMRRNNTGLRDLRDADATAADKAEQQMLPLYNDIATHFADLHDTPGRMKAKNCIVDVIPWKDSRRVFYSKLTRSLLELQAAHRLVASESGAGTVPEAQEILKKWFSEFSRGKGNADAKWGDDAAVTAWLEESQAEIVRRCTSLKSSAAADRFLAELQAAAGEDVSALQKACANMLADNDMLRSAMAQALKSLSADEEKL